MHYTYSTSVKENGACCTPGCDRIGLVRIHLLAYSPDWTGSGSAVAGSGLDRTHFEKSVSYSDFGETCSVDVNLMHDEVP